MDLVPKLGTKSLVWTYFGLEKSRDGKPVDDSSAICHTCRRRVLAKHGNTSNLLSHLKANHGKLYAEAKEAMTQRQPSSSTTVTKTVVSQPTIEETVESCQSYEWKGKRWQQLTDAITFFIAKDDQPLYTVEKDGFKRLVRAFDERYSIPSISYFSRTALPNLYAATKDQIKQEICDINNLSATTDLWSSEEMLQYMSYTIHFLDNDWQMQNRCLETQFLPEDHTGENLAKAIKVTLESSDLDMNNQICLRTDNETNITSAANQLSICRLSCFGHNLHLAITKSIRDDPRCTRAISLCRKIVSTFSMSWKRKRELTKAQLNLGLKKKCLVADCATRWGSLAIMIKRILQQEEAIRIVLSADQKTTHLILTWKDIDVLQSIDAALAPISSLTDILSGETYATVSAVFPILHLLNNTLLKESEDDTLLTKNLKSRIKVDLNERYTEMRLGDDVCSILQVSTVLDPRFKMKYVSEDVILDLNKR